MQGAQIWDFPGVTLVPFSSVFAHTVVRRSRTRGQRRMSELLLLRLAPLLANKLSGPPNTDLDHGTGHVTPTEMSNFNLKCQISNLDLIDPKRPAGGGRDMRQRLSTVPRFRTSLQPRQLPGRASMIGLLAGSGRFPILFAEARARRGKGLQVACSRDSLWSGPPRGAARPLRSIPAIVGVAEAWPDDPHL